MHSKKNLRLKLEKWPKTLFLPNLGPKISKFSTWFFIRFLGFTACGIPLEFHILSWWHWSVGKTIFKKKKCVIPYRTKFRRTKLSVPVWNFGSFVHRKEFYGFLFHISADEILGGQNFSVASHKVREWRWEYFLYVLLSYKMIFGKFFVEEYRFFVMSLEHCKMLNVFLSS